MTKCPKCGYKNPRNTSTCLNCGYPLSYSPTIAYLRGTLATIGSALITAGIILYFNLEVGLLVSVLGILVGNILYYVPLRRTANTSLFIILSTIAGVSLIPTVALEYWYFQDGILDLFEIAFIVAIFIAAYLIISVFVNEKILKYKGLINNEIYVILYTVLAISFLGIVLFVYQVGYLATTLLIGVIYLIFSLRL